MPITPGRQSVDTVIQLYRRHRPWVIRRCRMRPGNPHDVDDVTQDVFLRVIQSLDGYQSRGSFRAWLYRIVENECNSFALKRSRMAQGNDEHSFEVEESAILNDGWYLQDKLEGLPQLTRNLIYLSFFREYSLEAVADTLGLGLSATKMRLYHGLQQMRRWSNQGESSVSPV